MGAAPNFALAYAPIMSKPHSILAAVALGAAVALMLAGCTGAESDPPSSIATHSAAPGPAPFTPDPTKVAAYHTLVHDLPVYKDVTDAQLDEIAVKVCQLFRANGQTGWDDATGAVALTKDDPLPPRILVLAAVTLDCPQYTKDIPAAYR